MPIIPILFAAVFGFALGCKFKDCLCKKNGFKKGPKIPASRNQLVHPSNSEQTIKQPSPEHSIEFSLQSLDAIFKQYNIPLKSDYSFSRLLNTIEQESYISLMKYIDENISSPIELSKFLEEDNFNATNFEIKQSSGEPYIAENDINTILSNNGIDHTNFNTSSDKIKFLLICAQGKGTKRFQESFGNDLSLFLEKLKKNENSDVLYNSIKETIHHRLDFLK